MATGEYGIADVPKKAIEAQEVIYQASSLLAVTPPIIPGMDVIGTTIKFEVSKGTVGEYDVPFAAEGKHEKVTYDELETKIKWARYPYLIGDDAKLNARGGTQQLWDDAVASASEFFGTIRDYATITALAAGNVNGHTATAKWTADGGDPEGDIVTGLASVWSASNWQPREKISVIVPVAALAPLKKLNLIKNVQQRMQDYLEGSFDIDIVPYRAYLQYNTGTALFDALSDDALVVVNGRNTARFFRYSAAEAAARDCPLVEHSRIHGRGDYYTQKMGVASRVVWDALQGTNTKTTRIYKISTVA